MLKKAYLEITNVCNLSCSFCHGTTRKSHFLSTEEFRTLAEKLQGQVQFLYFHLMGEPLLHPRLGELFSIAKELGFKVILTTNGTLLPKQEDLLLAQGNLYKVSVSLHCYEVNSLGQSLEDYLQGVFRFCKAASAQGVLCSLRLWNRGGEDQLNTRILSLMEDAFPPPWSDTYSGSRLAPKVFLEWGERFDWPDPSAPLQEGSYGCYGLRDQIGIHCDGTVVPCCLDAEGNIPLGNLFSQDLHAILNSPRAQALKVSLQNRHPCEALCRHCGYAGQKKY